MTSKDERLLTDHYEYVVRVCQKLCKDEELGYDLAQTTMAHAWKNIDSFNGDANIRTWLYTIARNEFLDHLRRVKTRPATIEIQDGDRAYSPNMEAKLRVTRMIQSVGAELLLFVFGHSYKEIAERVGTTPTAVASRIHDQRQIVKRQHGTED